jgi:small subunit ribosomal protein S6
VAEQTYEGMFLLDSNKYASNAEGVVAEVNTIIERAGGKLLAERSWQDGKLAYEMDGHKKGLYYLTYFTCNTQGLTEIDRLVGYNETIIRHLVLKLDPALVQPLLDMVASGRSEVVSSFKDTESDALGRVGGPS